MERTPSCDSIWDLLSAYADGLTSPTERRSVEQHVAECNACSRDLDFMRGTSAILADIPEVSPPIGLRDAIFAATVNKRAWYQRLSIGGTPGFRQLAYAGAAAAAGVVLAFVVVGRERSNARDLIAPGSKLAGANTTPHDVKLRPPMGVELTPPLNRKESVAEHHPSTKLNEQPETSAPEPRTQIADAGYHPNKSVSVPTQGPLVPNKVLGTNRLSSLDPGRKKAAGQSAPPVDNIGPTMETANMLTPMTMDPDMSPMIKKADSGNGTETATTAGTAEPAHREYHIQLSSSDETVSAGSVASLADLRSSLKKNQTWHVPTIPLVRSNDRKEVKLDLVKGKF